MTKLRFVPLELQFGGRFWFRICRSVVSIKTRESGSSSQDGLGTSERENRRLNSVIAAPRNVSTLQVLRLGLDVSGQDGAEMSGQTGVTGQSLNRSRSPEVVCMHSTSSAPMIS